MAAPDPDPLYVFDEADNMCPNCITPWKCNGPHLSGETVAAFRNAETRDEVRSGAVVLYLAVILVAIATGAIIALLWWGLR